MIAKIILAPVVGGIIGYITNDLAIKMLFHPYKPIYIGKHRLPFTPGLIPSQKERIAKSLGQVIAGQLLNTETVLKEALSPETEKKIREKVRAWLLDKIEETETIKDKLINAFGEERAYDMGDRALLIASEFLFDQLSKAQIGEMIAENAVKELYDKVKATPFGFMVDASMLSGLKGTIAQYIDRKGTEKGPEMVREKLLEVGGKAVNKPLGEMAAPYKDRVDDLTEKIMNLYRDVMTSRLDGLLKAVEIDKIIERKISEFDAEMLEKLVFGIMKKELKAIVYLGALLGFLMGFVNLIW